MILASIFIGPPGRGEDLTLPPLVRENLASFRKHHPNLPHRLFSGEDCEAFLGKHFPREVLDAYRSLKPLAYKADLARYCILYETGGIYADLAFHFARPVPFGGERPMVFRDLIWSSPWDTSVGVIAMPPRHRALETAIELVCANVRQRYLGATNLCPTGPAVFGKALATTCIPDELASGLAMVLRREQIHAPPPLNLPDRTLCLAYPVTDRQIIAANRKREAGSGLAALGIADSDDYAARWENRDVYA